MSSWPPRSTTTPSTRRPTRPTSARVHDWPAATSPSIGWSDDAVDRVGSMIEATEHGAPGAEHAVGDTAILLDADLAILGADPAAYSAYVAGVRSEYRHVDDDDWRTGRAAVLARVPGTLDDLRHRRGPGAMGVACPRQRRCRTGGADGLIQDGVVSAIVATAAISSSGMPCSISSCTSRSRIP